MVERTRDGVMVTLPKEELDALRAENERRRQELAAAERDAERYRWLRDHTKHSVTIHCEPDEDGPERDICWSQIPEATEKAIDAAIDAEMKGKP